MSGQKASCWSRYSGHRLKNPGTPRTATERRSLPPQECSASPLVPPFTHPDPRSADVTPLEPIEEIQIDVDDEFVGEVVNALPARRAELIELRPSGDKSRAQFHGPARSLIGFHGVLPTVTRGTAVMHRIFRGYAPFKGPIVGRRNGVLVSSAEGKAVPYALWNPEPWGTLFVKPGMPVYPGIIVGE